MSTPTGPAFSCNTYLTLHEKGLMLSGVWPMNISKSLPKSMSWIGYLLDRSLIAFLFLNSVQLALCQMKTIYDKWGQGIDNLYVHGQEYLVAHTIVLLTILFQVERKGLIQLFVIINNNLRPRSAPGMTYTSMEKVYKFSQALTLIYMVFCVVGTFHHCMSPFWDGNRRLPVATWYPFDELKSPNYEVIYILQTIGTLQSGVIYSSIITLPFSITTLICGQYDLLYCSVHNIVNTAMLRRGDKKYVDYLRRKQVDWKEKNLDWIQYLYSEEYMEDLTNGSFVAYTSDEESVHQEVDTWRSFDADILELLNDCTVFHSFIIRTVKKSEECLRYILGASLIHFILLLCLLVYAMSRHLVLDNTLSHMLIYTGLTYALACLMCYPAHMLIYQVMEVEKGISHQESIIFYSIPEYSSNRRHHPMSLVHLWPRGTPQAGYVDGQFEVSRLSHVWQSIPSGLGDVCHGNGHCGSMIGFHFLTYALSLQITKASFSYFMLLRTLNE